MEENKHCADGSTGRPKCTCAAAAPFLAGLVVALAFGWWVFPGQVFSEKPQPFLFSHQVHVDAGKSCADCHSFREDGTFVGFPTLETCMECHADPDSPMTAEPGPDATREERAAYEAEVVFLKEYVAKEREIPWLAHQKQPDNVFFSHAVHFKRCFSCHGGQKGALHFTNTDAVANLCMNCHPSLEELDKGLLYEENALTGYSKRTMKMWQCEKCHAHPAHLYTNANRRATANNACYTCHK